MEAFYASVESLEEGRRLEETLARYDQFQFVHNVKPDFSNMGCTQVFEDGDWWDVEEEDVDI